MSVKVDASTNSKPFAVAFTRTRYPPLPVYALGVSVNPKNVVTSSPEFVSQPVVDVHVRLPLPSLANTEVETWDDGQAYVKFLIFTISPLLLTWNTSPFPTVNKDAGVVSPIPKLPAASIVTLTVSCVVKDIEGVPPLTVIRAV